MEHLDPTTEPDQGAWPTAERLPYDEHADLDVRFMALVSANEIDWEGAYCFTTDASADLFNHVDRYGESS